MKMYKAIIKQWIPKINKQDLITYLENNHIIASFQEIEILYLYLKTRWEEVYDEKPGIFQELQEKLSPALYLELYRLYQDMKKRLNI